MEMPFKGIVLIRGAGEIASGIAYGLHRANIKVCLTEISAPVAVARGVAFSEAIFDGTKTIMGITAELVLAEKAAIYRVWQKGNVPILIDPDASIRTQLEPDVLVDAIMAKRNTGTRITDAPLVVGVGPGFYAGKEVHVVVESNNDAGLGKLIFEGEAQKNTGIPVPLNGLSKERVLWATTTGVFTSNRNIGDVVTVGEVIAQLGDLPLKAPVRGVLRGLVRNGVRVTAGAKIIEVDPVHGSVICNFITDKVVTIGKAVLKAIMLKFAPGNVGTAARI